MEMDNNYDRKNSSEGDLLEGKAGLLAHLGMRELASLLQVRGEGKARGAIKSMMAASALILDQLSKFLNSTLSR